ncbi:hypothetical protein PENSPDRAFT_619205 [Peniophora sp. CONT]|nr:hypothetical protein PENSPDRAFT_619205 [Peniophora sp. CONT]
MSSTDLESANGDKGERKGKGGASSKSAKDLSHVPCKFYRVGACTAGASCPFSHSAFEPGQSKDTCAWFIKGNCKFGHKCALAHILPGQPMSMDRKNKKAAQQANAANGGGKERGGRGKGDRRRGDSNALFSGSTAPMRGGARAPMPMALKATISPSAPAPPISDSDFAALGMPDEATKLPSAPASRKATSGESPADAAPPEITAEEPKAVESPSRDSPKPLPVSTPSQPMRISDSRPPPGLAPIGSPRSNSSREHANGFSPGTSPSKGAAGMLSTSPFSAPGTQTAFNLVDKSDFRLRSGIAASLGATRSWADYSRLPSGGQDPAADGIVVEEDDLEEFVPGSLSELLSPEERERRYSRTAATQALNPNMASPRDNGWTVNGRPSVEAHHHRYSRSVPGVNPIQNMNIWSAEGAGFTGTSPGVGSPRTTAMSGLAGTPGSFKSGSVTGGLGAPRSFVDDAQISAFLSPTNASAAFLPGTAQHYMSKNNPMPRTLSDGPRQQSTLRGAYASTPPGANAANLLARLNEPVQPQTAGPVRTQFDGTSESLGGAPYALGARGGPGGLHDQQDLASPSAHVLQMHAPGQSLPQGLAAGYSRIHALPPPPVIPSPSASSALGSFVPGSSFSAHHNSHANVGDWMGMSPRNGPVGLTALDGHGQSPYAPMRTGGRPGAAPIASRTPSGKSWIAPTSPLSRPVLTGDDDDLFVLDH